MAGEGLLAYEGVRVLDITESLGGALASTHLACFGADVVRVAPGQEIKGGVGQNGLAEHLLATRAKRQIQLDWTDRADGTAECLRLAEGADIVVADAGLDRLDALGLHPEHLRDQHPGLIFLWMPPHAPRGSTVGLPPDDLLLSSWTGMADQQPGGKERPVAPVVPIFSYEQGLLGATAAAAALIGRASTGVGRAVTVSGMHAVAVMSCPMLVDVEGVVRVFSGPKSFDWGPPNYRMYRCGDGQFIFLAALSAPFYFSALGVLDLWDVMADPEVEGDFGRLRLPSVQARIGARVAARIAEHDRAYWLEKFAAERVPVAPISSREEWVASETVAANGLLVRASSASSDGSAGSEVTIPCLPVTLSRSATVETGLGQVVDPGSVNWPAAEGSRERGDATELPLAGTTVLDLSSFLAGPLATAILEDFGATVYKVEPPEGEQFRFAGAAYVALNRRKQQLSVDLKDDAGRRQLYDLARSADVVIENMREGAAAELGVDYATLGQHNEALVQCAIRGWGAGPLANTPAFDTLFQARGGLMEAQGGPDSPTIYAISVHDVGTATASAFGILTALVARERSGAGQEVAATLARTSIVFQSAEFTNFDGRPAPITGDLAYLGDPDVHRLYECSDGWIALGAPAGVAVSRLGLEKDGPAGAGDRPSRPEAAEVLAAALAHMTVDDALAALGAAGLPGTRAIDRATIFNSPDLADNGFFFVIDDPDLGPVTAVRTFAEWGLKADLK